MVILQYLLGNSNEYPVKEEMAHGTYVTIKLIYCYTTK